MKTDYDNWWASLTISEKERIALKANKKEVLYPECTDWWNGLLGKFKKRIHDHCTAQHGDTMPDEKEGFEMSY